MLAPRKLSVYAAAVVATLTLRQEVATDGVRKATRSRAYGSPMPGERRRTNGPA